MDSSPTAVGAAVEHEIDAAGEVGRTCAAVVVETWPERLADGATTGPPNALSSARAVGCRRHAQRNGVEAGGGKVGHRTAGRARQHQRQRSRPERRRQSLRRAVEHAERARRAHVGDMRDQRIERRPPLGGVEPRHGGTVGGIGTEAVHGLSRKRDQAASGEQSRRGGDAVRFAGGDTAAVREIDRQAWQIPFRGAEAGARLLARCPSHPIVKDHAMSYAAPVVDIAFALRHAAGLANVLESGLYGDDLSEDVVDAVLEEAGKYASDVIAPLNAIGDRHGTPFKDGRVTMPPGFKEAYAGWAAAGWNGLTGPAEYGGQALPHLINAACTEMWQAASMGFSVGPMLTMAAIDALVAHGSGDLKRQYLPKLVSGEWMGTMQLTEPQAGSDVGALRTRAERAGDGSYRITGSKIFITYGEHDLTDNIIHFVLARLTDAPPGNRGISLFLVPKFLLNPDGSLGAHNDVRCHSIEHKLGIHSSPTCTMVYGDAGGAQAGSSARRTAALIACSR